MQRLHASEYNAIATIAYENVFTVTKRGGNAPTLTFPTNGMRARSHNLFLCNAEPRVRAHARGSTYRIWSLEKYNPVMRSSGLFARIFNITFEDVHFPVHKAVFASRGPNAPRSPMRRRSGYALSRARACSACRVENNGARNLI